MKVLKKRKVDISKIKLHHRYKYIISILNSWNNLVVMIILYIGSMPTNKV